MSMSRLFLIFSALIAAACAQSPSPAAASQSSVRSASQILTPSTKKRGGLQGVGTSTYGTDPTGPVAVTYDTTMGASVDANGFTSLPLRAGAHKFYVNSSTGNDANGCTLAQNPATPLATSNTGINCITQGLGDQVLFAEGTTYTPWIYNGYISGKGGFSSTYPTVLSSYDPADPTNTAKYGRGDQRNARPLFTADMQASVNNGVLGGGPFSYFVFKGLAFNPGNIEDQGIGFIGDGTNNTGGASYLLIENNLFHYSGLGIDAATAVGQPFATSHIIIRNNDFDGGFDHSSNGRVGGVYTGGGITGITIEDNVFYHTGWKEGDADRSGTPLWGTQAHPAYIQTDTTNVAYRRNLVIEPTADGGIMRGNGAMTENVLIHVSAGLGLGPDGSHWADNANGVDADASYNLEIASIASGQPGGAAGYAFSSSKGNPGARIHHNLIVQSENSVETPSVFSNTSNGPTYKSYMEHENNLSFAWATAGHSIFTDPGANSANSLPFTTYDFNSWEDAASGSNTSNSGATYPNAYTLSTLLSAAGYANLSALSAYVIAHPEAHVQRTLRTLAFAGYGRADHAIDTTAPTLTLPTATSPSTGNATLGVTTNDATGRLYYELLTTGTAPHVSRIKVGVDSSDVAAPKAGSLTIASSGVKSVNVSGVPPGTYFAHFMHEDAEGNKSIAVTSTSFAVAGASVTWDGTNGVNVADWTLSGSNLIATRSSLTASNGLIRATSAKASGTFIVTVNAIGSADLVAVGLDLGDETGFLGLEGNGHSIGYHNSGNIFFGGSNAGTFASWTTGDVIKIVKAGVNVSFYKNNVLQTTIDTSSPTFGLGTVLSGAAYPAGYSRNGTGTQLTGDFSAF